MLLQMKTLGEEALLRAVSDSPFVDFSLPASWTRRPQQDSCTEGPVEAISVAKSFVFGFHNRWLRSVHHLHLHCLCPPFTPPFEGLRFQSAFFFVPFSRALAQLRGRV